jgi:hypothetical protein
LLLHLTGNDIRFWSIKLEMAEETERERWKEVKKWKKKRT